MDGIRQQTARPQPSRFTSTVMMSTPLPKSLHTCSHSTMCTAWGSDYCWPLVGTTSSCNCSSYHIGLPDESIPSATAVDQAEKTDEENKMEKWICKEVLGENLSPLNMLDRCLITFSHYQSLTSKSMTLSTSSSSVSHILVSFSIAPESRSPTLLPLDSPTIILLPSSRSLFRPFCPGGLSQRSAVNTNVTRLGTSRMGTRRIWGATYRARG